MQNVHSIFSKCQTEKPLDYRKKLADLKKIRLALAMFTYWKAGPREVSARTMAVGTSMLFFLVLLCIPQSELELAISLKFAISMPVAVLAYVQTLWLSSKPISYSQKLFRLLAEYDPVDKEAYRILQMQTQENQGINRHALAQWLDCERWTLLAITKPKTELTLDSRAFLNKKV